MRKIKWGVMGTADIFARDTADGMMQAENCQMYAIAGRNAEKAEAFRARYGFEKAYGSYAELLEDPEVEAVYIPLPNTLHLEWTVRALQAKKHVLCEKPLGINAAESEKMYAAARENNVILMEAFAYQHSPFVAAVKAELDSGVIGDVRYIESELITSDYDMSNIRMRRETCGGSTYDLGVYPCSLILRMLGQEPEQVKAIGTFSAEKIDLFTAAVLEFAGGIKAQFNSGMVLATNSDGRIDSMKIHGTRGSIEAINFAFNLPGQLSYRLRTFDGVDEVKYVECPHNYRLEVEQLGRCITDGEKPLMSEELSMAVARTIDRVLEEIGY